MSVAKGFLAGSGQAVGGNTVSGNTRVSIPKGSTVQSLRDLGWKTNVGQSNTLLEAALCGIWGTKPSYDAPASDLPTSPDNHDLESYLTEFLGAVHFPDKVVVSAKGLARFLNVQDLITFENPGRSEGMVLLDRKLQILAGSSPFGIDPKAAAALFLASEGQDLSADLVAQGLLQLATQVDFLPGYVVEVTCKGLESEQGGAWASRIWDIFGTHCTGEGVQYRGGPQLTASFMMKVSFRERDKNPWYRPILRAAHRRFPLDVTAKTIRVERTAEGAFLLDEGASEHFFESLKKVLDRQALRDILNLDP